MNLENSQNNLLEITKMVGKIDYGGLAQALMPIADLSSTYKDKILSLSTGMLNAMERAFVGWERNNLVNHAISTSVATMQQELAQIGGQYTRMLSGVGLTSDAMRQALTGFTYQTMALQSLVQVSQTPMIEALKGFVTNINVDGCVRTMTQAMGASIIHASDLALARSSVFGQDLVDLSDIPIVVQKALKRLNCTTAKALSSEASIIYDVDDEVYVDESVGEYEVKADFDEINSIGYACVVLNQDNDEQTGILCDISATDLMNFMTFLSLTRSFANEHPAGKKIIDAIASLWDRQSYLGFDRDFYYHSRALEPDQTPYVYEEMLKAPYGVTGPGRYNYPGEAYYYTADTKDGAEEEVRLHNKGKKIQTVKLKPHFPAKFLDLSVPMRWGREFLKYIRFDASGNMESKMPKEYLIPNYVSDCCRKVGFDGIKYYGGKGYSNYVVWSDGHYDYVEMM